MTRFLLAVGLLVPAASLAFQPSPDRPSGALEPRAAHLVMITGAGPNFAKAREYAEEAKKHHAIYEKLAADGFTIAGGAFEGAPTMGMTIWREGIDEKRARELIKDDQMARLGVVTYEFRTLRIRYGSFGT